jgi:N-acetylmuramoyl-L-alanine amidase
MKRFLAPTLIIIFLFACVAYAKDIRTMAPATASVKQAVEIPEKIKILIVAGHDNEVWGSQFMGVKEVELNRILATDLYNILKADPMFEPTINQENGDYITQLAEFFEKNEAQIEAFRKERKENFAKEQEQEKEGEEGDDVHQYEVKHNKVSTDVANRLYGTSMWAQGKGFDAVIHVHFNDYPGRPKNQAGKYRGFVIYTPSTELKNGEKSISLAHAIYDELAKYQPKSNLPVEKDGVIESKDLIALGARNSLNIPAVLIEYAYIAEPRLQGEGREKVIQEMAEQTYAAIKNYSFLKVQI